MSGNYIRIGIFAPEDVLPYVSKITHVKHKEYCGKQVRMGSQRYVLFSEKGLTCVECGLKGRFFALEKQAQEHDRFHFNMYGINSEGEEVLFTKDHIIPRSKGGANAQHNYQVMCSACNHEKDDKLELPETKRVKFTLADRLKASGTKISLLKVK